MKQLFTSQIKAIGDAVTVALREKEAKAVLHLVQSQDILLRAIADNYGLDEEPKEWPEGASNDNPSEEAPDESKEREKKGGFFA